MTPMLIHNITVINRSYSYVIKTDIFCCRYDAQGSQLIEPFVIGICGGSASGKTTVAQKETHSMIRNSNLEYQNVK